VTLEEALVEVQVPASPSAKEAVFTRHLFVTVSLFVRLLATSDKNY